MTNLTKTRLFGVLAALAVMMMTPAALAAPGTIDSAATDTTDITYVSDGETIDDAFNASADATYGLPILNSTTDNLAMNVTHDGVEYYTFSGTWDAYASGEADETNDYVHNFTGADLSRVPMAINKNVTLNVTYWNASADAANRTPTTITVTVQNTDERAVQRVTENASFADVEEQDAPFYRRADLGYLSANTYEAVSVDDTVNVNGSDTDIIYTLSDTTVQDPFANVSEDLEDAGAFTLAMASLDADSEEKVPVFYKSAPDWYDSEDMGSYAVINPSDNTVTFDAAGENFEGATTTDVALSSDTYRVMDLGTVWDLAGGYSGAGIQAVTDMVM